MGKPMLIIGHRGSSYDDGENSIAGITTAVNAGVDGIEIDLRRSDDQVILLHDNTVDRTTNGHGAHKNFAFSSLRRLVLKNGGRIPTLAEVMPLLLKVKYIYLEIKEPNLLAIIWPILSKIPDRNKKNIFISSFDAKILGSIGKDEKIKKAFVTEIPNPNPIALCKELNCSQIHLSFDITDRAIVEEAHKNSINVFVFNINELCNLEHCLSLGVDGIFTDFPIAMIKALSRTTINYKRVPRYIIR